MSLDVPQHPEFPGSMMRYRKNKQKYHFWPVELSYFKFWKYYYMIEHLWNNMRDNIWQIHKTPQIEILKIQANNMLWSDFKGILQMLNKW